MVKNCPECGTPRMEPYDHNAKHELLFRCNKCGFKESKKAKEYCHFEITEEKPKTNVYQVLTNKKIIESGCLPHHILLGVIEWRVTWRQYVFTPTLEFSSDWSLGCLTQITGFLRELKGNKKLIPKELA